MQQDHQTPPLKDITVLDLSRVLAGPFCTMILAQLGARVIKVEMPGTGDDSRAFGPFANGKSLYFSALNYDKQSIALNLKQAPDRKLFEGLSALSRKCSLPQPVTTFGTMNSDVLERTLPGYRRPNFCDLIAANPLGG